MFVHMPANPLRRTTHKSREKNAAVCLLCFLLFIFLQDVNRRLAGRSSRRCGAGLRRAEGSGGGGIGGGGGSKGVSSGARFDGNPFGHEGQRRPTRRWRISQQAAA